MSSPYGTRFMNMIYRSVNYVNSPSHTYGCCKAHYKCPCMTGGKLDLVPDPVNPKYFYKKHYRGCNISGTMKCECWKYPSDDPTGERLDAITDPCTMYKVIIDLQNAAYKEDLPNFKPYIPITYYGRVKDPLTNPVSLISYDWNVKL